MGKFDEINEEEKDVAKLSEGNIKTYNESVIAGSTLKYVTPSVIKKHWKPGKC